MRAGFMVMTEVEPVETPAEKETVGDDVDVEPATSAANATTRLPGAFPATRAFKVPRITWTKVAPQDRPGATAITWRDLAPQDPAPDRILERVAPVDRSKGATSEDRSRSSWRRARGPNGGSN
jgi:hypothetical protein